MLSEYSNAQLAQALTGEEIIWRPADWREGNLPDKVISIVGTIQTHITFDLYVATIYYIYRIISSKRLAK